MAKKRAKQKQMIWKATTQTHYWTVGDTAAQPRNGYAMLGVSIGTPPPVTNPLHASGTFNNCCASPAVTVWLTDADGDQTFVTPTLTGGPPPTNWAADFPAMPAGDYTLTIRLQCGNNVISQTMTLSLPNPS